MRVEGWEKLLAEHIEHAYRRQFEWGVHDCALWSADWAGKGTARDYITGWKGSYKTELGAGRAMKKRGYSSVEAIADSHLLSVPVTLAKRGDLMLHPQGCLGICNGRNSIFLTADSVITMPTLDCPKAWTVD